MYGPVPARSSHRLRNRIGVSEDVFGSGVKREQIIQLLDARVHVHRRVQAQLQANPHGKYLPEFNKMLKIDERDE